MQRLCVFCGSRDGAGTLYREVAFSAGQAIAAAGLDLVYGGAQNGLMGALADGVLSGGRAIVGVIPHGLARQEFAHPRLTDVHHVGSMHERKALMERLSDAFLALPGGFGTMDELFEALSWAQLGLHRKPVGLLDVGGFYAPLVAWVRAATQAGFVAPEHAEVLVVDDEPARLVRRLVDRPAPAFPVRWSPGVKP